MRLVPPHGPRSGGLLPNPDRAAQMSGAKLRYPGGVDAMPVWQRHELVQDSSDHFVIRKGCGEHFTLIDAHHGRRAPGTVAVTDSAAGVALGVRDFWRAYPSALTVANAGREDLPARVTAWLWPPQAPAADLRHYTDTMYGPMYECHHCLEWEAGPADPARSTPYGIGRTSEVTLSVPDVPLTEDTLAGDHAGERVPGRPRGGHAGGSHRGAGCQDPVPQDPGADREAARRHLRREPPSGWTRRSIRHTSHGLLQPAVQPRAHAGPQLAPGRGRKA